MIHVTVAARTESESIQCISSKIARNVAILRKLKYSFPVNILRLIYFSIVPPYLVYCCSVWSSTFQTHLKSLCALQNLVIRVLINCDNRISVIDSCKKINILAVPSLFNFYKSLFMFDILHKNAPECLFGMFERCQPVYETRNSSALRKPTKSSTRSSLSIRHVLASLWESLPYVRVAAVASNLVRDDHVQC
jgi:hypothetical protein